MFKWIITQGELELLCTYNCPNYVNILGKIRSLTAQKKRLKVLKVMVKASFHYIQEERTQKNCHHHFNMLDL